ncbi:MAG TPA: M3 family oligoendopeptidase, partial [Chlamydiales bacterium]|nr:M3 family oligoendopeptidase [Chlamydiales bacterium]
TAWVEPELLSLPEETLKKLADSVHLADYKMVLDRIIRLKPHTLSAKEQQLLALGGRALQVSERAFGAMNNADIKFPSVKDKDGKEHELSHGLYQTYLRSSDRILRENAFKTLHQTFLNFENTLCELLSGSVQKHIYYAKAKHYNSALEAALYPHQIDPAVYVNLIDATHAHLGKLHRFIALRKKLMGLPDLHVYDLYAPAAAEIEMKFSYDEAVEVTLEAVQPLGPGYCQVLKRGLKDERWIDRYENNRKRSGAYSSGCYESYPYILLNFQGFLNDVMTLAHEAGHSMHTYFSNQSQPFHDSHYSIFVAEVASTFNEELVFRHLLASATDKKQRIFLLLQKLDGIRATFFRQVMFAEFEKQIHEMAEKEIPLTPATLRKAYRELNALYFGPELTLDNELEGEFMRVPHFYYDFYVYQYSTGI